MEDILLREIDRIGEMIQMIAHRLGLVGEKKFSDRALETFIEILFYSDLDESKKAGILKEALSYLDSKGYISFKLHSLITD